MATWWRSASQQAPDSGMTERRRDRAAMDKYAVGGPSPVDVPLAHATRKRTVGILMDK
jgi:hypothetical protein